MRGKLRVYLNRSTDIPQPKYVLYSAFSLKSHLNMPKKIFLCAPSFFKSWIRPCHVQPLISTCVLTDTKFPCWHWSQPHSSLLVQAEPILDWVDILSPLGLCQLKMKHVFHSCHLLLYLVWTIGDYFICWFYCDKCRLAEPYLGLSGTTAASRPSIVTCPVLAVGWKMS